MADWSRPTGTTELYAALITLLKDRDFDSLTLLLNAATNLPVGAIRFNRATLTFEEWSGTVWNTLIINSGGSTDPAAARAALGLGTMAVQNSNAVAITGGTISGSGVTNVIGDIIPLTDNVSDLGSSAKKWAQAWIKGIFGLPIVNPSDATPGLLWLQGTNLRYNDSAGAEKIVGISAAGLALTVVDGGSITTSVNNLGLSSGSGIIIYRVNFAGGTITGLGNGYDGRIVYIHNIGGSAGTITHQDAASLAANRFSNPGGSNFNINNDRSVGFWYDSITTRWRILSELN